MGSKPEVTECVNLCKISEKIKEYSTNNRKHKISGENKQTKNT